MDNKKFADLVIERRKKLNLTQKDLALKLNVTDKAISKWERGKSLPDISLLSKLAEVLEISLLELMNEDSTFNEELSQNKEESLSSLNDLNIKPKHNKKYRIIRSVAAILGMVLFVFILIELTKKPKEVFNEPIEGMLVSAGFYAFEGHDGVDIVNQDIINGNSTELYSIAKGIISDFGMSQHDGYFIKIDYEEFQVIFSHLDSLDGISKRIVEKGELITQTGKNSSGNNTGPHIEMQVISNDVIVDPIEFLNYE
ncbi:MAG TPA: helix-turn-helix domain-containing protein [Erysipelotrichaceae bacterium]|nr:helix-turn-helix domain-containing protein [Erysipelotrichaceae bacterium]